MSDVTCDKCSKVFEMDVKWRNHGEGVQEMYFKCPGCNAHYTGLILDDAGRKMQRDVRKLQDQIAKARGKNPEGGKREKQLTYQMGQIGKKLAVKMDKLKKKYVKEAV